MPAGLPEAYVLGDDVTFPVPYAVFPTDTFAGVGASLAYSYQQDGTSVWTRIPTARKLDCLIPSEAASDHLIVFGDFVLPDLVAPSPRFVGMGFESGQLALHFVEPSGLPVTFRLEARQAIGGGIWVALAATLEGPDAGGRYRYLTWVPAAARGGGPG